MSEIAPVFNGIPVVVNAHLAGMKNAVKLGGTLYVSPAMGELMRTATAPELETLLRYLKMLDLDPRQHDARWWADTWQIFAAQHGLNPPG